MNLKLLILLLTVSISIFAQNDDVSFKKLKTLTGKVTKVHTLKLDKYVVKSYLINVDNQIIAIADENNLYSHKVGEFVSIEVYETHIKENNQKHITFVLSKVSHQSIEDAIKYHNIELENP